MIIEWMWRHRCAILVLCVLTMTLTLGSPLHAQTTVADIQRTYRELRRYKLPDESASEDRDIPPRIRWLQTRFKHQLRDLVAEILNRDVGSITRPTSEIRTMIHARFKALSLITHSKEHLPFFSFGHALNVTVETPANHPDFLAVTVVVDASWAEDASLYIFRYGSDGWKHILGAEVNNYRQVRAAQSSALQYAISASAADGSWFVVTASVNPYMASAWQRLTYTALAVGEDPDHPRELVHRRHDIYLEKEAFCHIKTSKNGFLIWFPVGFSPAENRYTDEYRVANGTAHRIVMNCRTRDDLGRLIACDTRNHSYGERLEGTFRKIKRKWRQ